MSYETEMVNGAPDSNTEPSGLDWLLDKARAQDSRVPGHYWHINDGEADTCGCTFQGEQ